MNFLKIVILCSSLFFSLNSFAANKVVIPDDLQDWARYETFYKAGYQSWTLPSMSSDYIGSVSEARTRFMLQMQLSNTMDNAEVFYSLLMINDKVIAFDSFPVEFGSSPIKYFPISQMVLNKEKNTDGQVQIHIIIDGYGKVGKNKFQKIGRGTADFVYEVGRTMRGQNGNVVTSGEISNMNYFTKVIPQGSN